MNLIVRNNQNTFYIFVLGWNLSVNQTFVNFTAVDALGRTWDIPSAQVKETRIQSDYYPNYYTARLETDHATRRGEASA